MSIFATKIQTIVEGQGLTYYRAVNINDLNEWVGNSDLSGGVGIYANLPEVDFSAFGKTNAVLMQYPIEVYYLQLNSEIDPTGDDVETILDALFANAQGLIDQLYADSTIVATGQYIDSYSISGVDSLKMTKEVMTGWRVTCTIPTFRTQFECA